MKVGSVDSSKAIEQHRLFVSALRICGAEVVEVPFVHGVFDSVFAKDNAIIVNSENRTRALMTAPSTMQRKAEQNVRRRQLESLGVEILGEAEYALEGGDVLFAPNSEKIFFGYGQRSSYKAVGELRKHFGYDVIPLELIDPFFFHLDTALNFVDIGGRTIAFAYREAFSDLAWEYLTSDFQISAVVEVSREEAMVFALNWVEVNDNVILGSAAPSLRKTLESLGKKVLFVPLDQFQLAGGSAACLATRIHDVSSVAIGNKKSQLAGELALPKFV